MPGPATPELAPPGLGTARPSPPSSQSNGKKGTAPISLLLHPALLARLAGIASNEGLRATLCAQPGLLALGLEPARCIDAARLSDIAGRPISARPRGNRPGCLCAEARDIGAYDSCAQGCVYCYAVADQGRAGDCIQAADMAAPRLGQRLVGQSDGGGQSLATPTSAGLKRRPFSV